MRYLEVRRHTMRRKPGKHLTQAGVTLARTTGVGMGPFVKVVTSDLPRAFETAIAMGFAVDEQLDDLAPIADEAVAAVVEEAPSFYDVVKAMQNDKTIARYARKLAKVWTWIVEPLPDDAAGLIVAHGGVIELGVAGCLPDLDYSEWGEPCACCEGVRLSFDGKAFVDAKLLRVIG